MNAGGSNGDDDCRDGRDRQNDGDRQDDQNRQGQQNGRGRRPSTAEKALTGVSVVFTVLLFGYVAWQAVQSPGGTHPQVEVVETNEAANGSVLVHVALTNPGDEGLISATVEADCDRPPPDATFEYVPSGGRERGVLVCPPGTTRPNASVSAWIPT